MSINSVENGNIDLDSMVEHFKPAQSQSVIDLDRIKQKISNGGSDSYKKGIIVQPLEAKINAVINMDEHYKRLGEYAAFQAELQEGIHSYFPQVMPSIHGPFKRMIQGIKRRLAGYKKPSLDQLYDKMVKTSECVCQASMQIDGVLTTVLDKVTAHMMSHNNEAYEHSQEVKYLLDQETEFEQVYNEIRDAHKQAESEAEQTNLKNLMIQAATAVCNLRSRVIQSRESIQYLGAEEVYLTDLHEGLIGTKTKNQRLLNRARLIYRTYELTYDANRAIGLASEVGLLGVRQVENSAKLMLGLGHLIDPKYTQFTEVNYTDQDMLNHAQLPHSLGNEVHQIHSSLRAVTERKEYGGANE